MFISGSLWFSKPTISSTVVSVVMFSSVRACFSLPVSGLWSVLQIAYCFSNPLVTKSLLQFIFKNFDTILHKLYCLNWYKLLTRALSSLLNGRLHHKCIVTALKIIHNNVGFFCLHKMLYIL